LGKTRLHTKNQTPRVLGSAIIMLSFMLGLSWALTIIGSTKYVSLQVPNS
jgi:hypothetical protein